MPRVSKNKAVVLQKLLNLDVRQLQREAAREMLNRVRHLYRARRDGHLDSLESAIRFCKEIGLMGMAENYYGITLLHVSAGGTLAYGPDGRPCWRMLPALAAVDAYPQNMEFCFSEEKTTPDSTQATTGPTSAT